MCSRDGQVRSFSSTSTTKIVLRVFCPSLMCSRHYDDQSSTEDIILTNKKSVEGAHRQYGTNFGCMEYRPKINSNQ